MLNLVKFYLKHEKQPNAHLLLRNTILILASLQNLLTEPLQFFMAQIPQDTLAHVDKITSHNYCRFDVLFLLL